MVSQPLIINISGKARHGKDTFGRALEAYFGHDYNVQVLHFADPVKEFAKECGWDGKKDHNGVALLQFIGTEYGREQLGKDFWVYKAKERLKGWNDIVIFPDTRFRNEIEFWDEFKGEFNYPQIKIRVRRLDWKGEIWKSDREEDLKNHESENRLDDYEDWDFVVEAKNLAELHRKAIRASRIIEDTELKRSD